MSFSFSVIKYCKVSKQRGGKSYIDRGDNQIEILTNSSETKEESDNHHKKNNGSKTRLNEEARYSTTSGFNSLYKLLQFYTSFFFTYRK
jgi:hypothetical protein